jgi:hypothetical protein
VATATARLSLTVPMTAAAVTLTTGAPTTEPTGGRRRRQPRRSRTRGQPCLRCLTGLL